MSSHTARILKIPTISNKNTIYVGMPRSPAAEPKFESVCAWFSSSRNPNTKIVRQYVKGSLLTHCFNSLFCDALNLRKVEGVTHFAMLHTDLVPEPGWVDILLRIMEERKAAIVSAVVPHRSDSGKTSTATWDGVDKWKAKIMTMRDCFKEDPTFTKPNLLVNSGCMLINLTGDHLNPMLTFQQHDENWYNPDTEKWETKTLSEDWAISIQIAKNGGTVYATREVKVWHGERKWHNMSEWGTVDAPSSDTSEKATEAGGQSSPQNATTSNRPGEGSEDGYRGPNHDGLREFPV